MNAQDMQIFEPVAVTLICQFCTFRGRRTLVVLKACRFDNLDCSFYYVL